MRSGRDLADGRVRLVTRTDRGDAAADAARRAIAAVGRDWRAEVGAEAFETMKQALRQLGRDSFLARQPGLVIPASRCHSSRPHAATASGHSPGHRVTALSADTITPAGAPPRQ